MPMTNRTRLAAGSATVNVDYDIKLFSISTTTSGWRTIMRVVPGRKIRRASDR